MGIGDVLRKVTGSNYDGDDDSGFVDDTPTMSSTRYSEDFGYGAKSTGGSGKVLSIAATTHLQVIVFKPQKYSEAAEIADHFKNKKTIVLNLENTNKDVANRLIDFLGGVAYAADGETRVDTRATLTDDDARINLRAFLVAFHNARMHLHGVADVECRTVCLELFTFYFFDNRHIFCPSCTVPASMAMRSLYRIPLFCAGSKMI